MKINHLPSTPIRYDVDLSGVKTNQIKVTMTLDLPGDKPVDVELPVVGPGAPDNNMNYARRLTGIQVTDDKGNEVRYEKLIKGGWRIHREEMSAYAPVKVSYVIDAGEFDFVRAQLNEDHAYMNGSQTFMFVKDHQRDLAAIVHLENIPNKTWKSVSTLRPVEGKKNTFYSPYFEDLADSNTEVGNFKQVKRFVNGTEITMAQHGEPPYKHLAIKGVDLKQNMKDFAKIYSTFVKEFGPFPAQRYFTSPEVPDGVDQKDRYVVIKHYVKEHHGATGLEHYHGHELQWMQRHEYSTHRVYGDDPRFLENEVMAHELGHKLDAKFVQHKGIDTSDFSKSQPTDGLWYTEGVTDWIAPYVLTRAHLITPKQYLSLLQTNINQYHLDYFVNPTNACEDSMDAQMGRAGYYNKGGLLGTMLDLEIRHRTGGKKSFADVLREVKNEFGGTGKFHDLANIQRAAEKVAGGSLKEFFDSYLRDRQPIDFNHYLAYAGYSLKAREDAWDPAELRLPVGSLKSNESGKLTLEAPNGEKQGTEFPLTFLPSLGVFLEKSDEGGMSIYSVRPDGPGYAAGLRSFVDKKLDSVIFRVSASSGSEKGASVKQQVEIEMPLDPKKSDGNEAVAGLLKSLSNSGKPLEVKEVGFKIAGENYFGKGKEEKVVWVSPGPAKKYVLEELPNVTSAQKSLREGWLDSGHSPTKN